MDEAPLHIFYTCNITPRLWNKFQYFVSQYLYIPEIFPQSVFFGFFSIGNQKQEFAINQLLIFKHYRYLSREHVTVCFANLKLYLIKMKTVEQNIIPCSSQKKERCRRKWRVIENIQK